MKNYKLKIAVLTILSIICITLLGIHIYYSTHPLSLKEDTIELSIGDQYDYKDNIDKVYRGSVEDVTINKKIDTSKVDTYTITYTYKKYNKDCKIVVKDTEPPVLKLRDYTTDMVSEVNAKTFVKSCKDDSKYTLKLLTKDTSQEGKTTIQIKAKDIYDNEVIKECTLTRIKDTTPPEISGILSSYQLTQGETIDYKDVVVKDDLDKNPSLTIKGEVNFNKVGTYTVTYIAKDHSGNKTTLKSTFTIKARIAVKGKNVYLTFDDGPSYNTAKILDILNEYDVHATFFVTGNGQSYNSYIKKAYDAGNAIGLHTYSHQYSIYTSKEDYFNDLNKIQNMVTNIIGVKSNIIRFPGGSSNTVSASYCQGIMTTLTQAVMDKGYQYYDWNVDSGDANAASVAASTIVQNATSGKGNNLIILMHDESGKDTTVEALPSIIEYYQSKGYTFKVIDKDSTFICHHGVNN